MIERTKMFEIRENTITWIDEIDEIKKLDLDPEKTILYNFPNNIEAMFYTGFTVYPKEIPEDRILELESEDYTIINWKANID